MNRRSIAVTCRQRIVELTHPQGTPLDIVLSLGPGMAITESTVFRADLQTARYPVSAPLARTADVTAAPGATGPWTLPLSGAQLNQTVTGESRRFWLPIYAVVGGTRIEPLVGIVISLTANNISSLAPPPPVEPLYLTAESASDLYAALADFEDLADRVTSLENAETGGAQPDWNATSGPSAILNKPSLGNSSSRNVGTGAGDVAAGNHNHSSTSQIAGLDAALAAKADLAGGKIPASQIPSIAISDYLGSVASQSAMLALNGERGDYCTRSDLGKAFILIGEPSSLLVNWIEWVYPLSPVISVAGKTGTVTLSAGDLTDASAVGIALLTALTVAAQRSALGLGALSILATVGTAQIDNAAVTNAKLANMGAATFKGSIAGGTPSDLSATEATSLLNVFSSTLKGLVPASGGGTTAYLRADGTWATPPGGSPAGTGSEIQFRNAGVFGAVTGSSVSGSVVTLGELRVNNGTATTGLRVTADSVTTNLFFNGTGTDGFIYGGPGAGTNAVAVRGSVFRVEGSGASDSLALLQIGNSARVLIRARALNNICFGPADTSSASVVAQTLSVQSATGTNQSASSAVFSFDGAQGTGTGAGGDVRVRVAPNGSWGASQNPLVEAVRFRATDLATVCAGPVIAGGPVVLPSFTVATVPSASLWTRGNIYVSDEGGGATPAFSDGINWRRYSDRAVVSTTPS